MLTRLTSSGKRARLFRHGFHQDFRRDGNFAYRNSDRILNGIYDCGGGPIGGQFSDSLGAVRAEWIGILFKKYSDGRNVRGRGGEATSSFAELSWLTQLS